MHSSLCQLLVKGISTLLYVVVSEVLAAIDATALGPDLKRWALLQKWRHFLTIVLDVRVSRLHFTFVIYFDLGVQDGM